jgi:hypothetical protein
MSIVGLIIQSVFDILFFSWLSLLFPDTRRLSKGERWEARAVALTVGLFVLGMVVVFLAFAFFMRA